LLAQASLHFYAESLCIADLQIPIADSQIGNRQSAIGNKNCGCPHLTEWG
jgi:hypothetical protein